MWSSYEKLRRVVLSGLFSLLLVTCALLLVFRTPRGEDKVFEREILYQMVDLGQGDWIRFFTESIFQNKRVFRVPDGSEIDWVYLSKRDFRKCWPESPWDMKEKGYTIKATFKYRLLLFINSYSTATVENVERVAGKPRTRK